MDLADFKVIEGTGSDTVRVTLKEPKIHIPGISEYDRCYSADLSVNGRKHVFKRIELPSHSPKSTQYNLTDSCFYLTFSLSPQNQTKGEKMEVSIFIFSDSIPHQGQRFKIITPGFNEDNPIMEWTRDIGFIAVMQVGFFPKASDIYPASDSINDRRIALSTINFTGEMEVLSIKPGKYQDQLEIELGLTATAILDSEQYDTLSIPLNINGKISLFQTEHADIVPCFFIIDYGWPDLFLTSSLCYTTTGSFHLYWRLLCLHLDSDAVADITSMSSKLSVVPRQKHGYD